MTTVILAEKSNQANDYSKAFQSAQKKQGYYLVKDNSLVSDDEVIITHAIGHLVGLAMPKDYDEKYQKWTMENLPIFPEKFKFNVTKQTMKQYKIVKELLSKADTIIIATDPDREGENIAYSIFKKAGINLKEKTIKRLWINSLESDVIRAGFQNLRPYTETFSFYVEAQSRQIADWLTGMNLSRLVTLSMQQKGLRNGTFSVGRVQTPTLYLIYKRNKEIENFTPEPYYQLKTLIHADHDFIAQYKDNFKSKEEMKLFLGSHSMNGSQQKATIKKVTKTEKKKNSPKLFSLNLIQKEASKKYKLKPADTLKTVQNLYEKKLVSYPRTSCNFITESEYGYLKAGLETYLSFLNLNIENKNLVPEKTKVNNEKVLEHYAIIPTKRVATEQEFEALSSIEKNIYKDILKRTIAMFETPYIYEETEIIADVQGADFYAKGNVMIDLGYKRILQEKEQKESEPKLPQVKETEVYDSELKTEEKFTKPKPYYTSGTILDGMMNAGKELDDKEKQAILKETKGLGTEATRANIIETLFKEQYIEEKENKLFCTPKGALLCETLEPFSIVDPAFTAEWEQNLEEIGKGNARPKLFLDGIKENIENLIQVVPNGIKKTESFEKVQEAGKAPIVGTCPNCKKDIQDKGTFYGCSGYKEGCKFSLPKSFVGKKLTEKNIEDLLTKKETAQLKGFKKKDKSTFSAILILDSENKLTFKPYKK